MFLFEGIHNLDKFDFVSLFEENKVDIVNESTHGDYITFRITIDKTNTEEGKVFF